MKSQRSSSQMSTFLVNSNLLIAIRDMWAGHFEALELLPKIQILIKFPGLHAVFMKHWYSNDPSGILCEPLKYEEISYVCSNLKSGVSSVEIDYEHIRHAGPRGGGG